MDPSGFFWIFNWIYFQNLKNFWEFLGIYWTFNRFTAKIWKIFKDSGRNFRILWILVDYFGHSTDFPTRISRIFSHFQEFFDRFSTLLTILGLFTILQDQAAFFYQFPLGFINPWKIRSNGRNFGKMMKRWKNQMNLRGWRWEAELKFDVADAVPSFYWRRGCSHPPRRLPLFTIYSLVARHFVIFLIRCNLSGLPLLFDVGGGVVVVCAEQTAPPTLSAAKWRS